MNNEIDIILARYFSGEATKKELQALDIWLSKSEENEEKFHQMTLLYQYTGKTDSLPAFNTEKALDQFKSYIHEKEKSSHKSSFNISRIWRAAAAIAILLMGTFAIFYYMNQPSKMIRVMASETQKEITIFENTEVTLFPGTEIIYHAQSNREVQLKGKATFKIDSETSAGILVQAGETFIKDIGTIFTVDALNIEKSITVEVAEGEVWFFTETNSGVYVRANESAVYNVQTKQFAMIESGMRYEVCGEGDVQAEQFEVVESDETIIEDRQDVVETVGARRALPLQPELVFQNTSLTTAINLIKTHYGIDIIVISNELNEILLNVSFDNNESVEYVLEIIAATVSARLEKQGNQYIIISHD